eukprot:7102047-Alexandrium_andersonii.AAC.1
MGYSGSIGVWQARHVATHPRACLCKGPDSFKRTGLLLVVCGSGHWSASPPPESAESSRRILASIGAGLDDAASSAAPEGELFLGSMEMGANGDAAPSAD